MKKSNKGFTLVEVMIVVAIIGLLAAIAIPNLLRARINANDGAARGDLRAFSTAAESFRAANNAAYPDDIADLTGGTNPYLDGTWTQGADKHGHNIDFNNTADGSAYSLVAETLANQSATIYCIDSTGVLRSGTACDTDALACPTVNCTPVV